MITHTAVSVFTLIDTEWCPVVEGDKWVHAGVKIEGNKLKLQLSLDSNFGDTEIILHSVIETANQWLLVSDDFAEFEDISNSKRYGFYFESPDEASRFTDAVSEGTETAARQVIKKPSRKKSLADFGDVDAAIQAALISNTLSVDFSLAVSKQLLVVQERNNSTSASDGNDDDNCLSTPVIREHSVAPPPPPVSTVPVNDMYTDSRASQSFSPPPCSDSNISGPTSVTHKLQVVFNEDMSRFEGLPPQWKDQNKQFGVALQHLQKRRLDGYAEGIPTVLDMLKRHFVKNNGIQVVGVFRLAPDSGVCATIKNQIDTGDYEGTDDVNVLANLIKVFFRELPVNLFNNIPEQTILRIASKSIDDCISEMDSALGQHTFSSVIYWLLDLMAEVVMNEDVNRMSAKNMAIVMSPNLFSVNTENPMVALTMAQKVAEFTTKLLCARLKTKYNYIARA